MNSFSVRAAAPADHVGLSRLLAALLGRDFLPEAVAQALNANLLRLLSQPGGSLLVADQGGSLLGFVSLWSRWGLFEDAPAAVIDALMVHPDHREGSAPAALIEQALGAAQAMGCTSLEFLPSEDSTVPKEVLERFGFVRGPDRFALQLA